MRARQGVVDERAVRRRAEEAVPDRGARLLGLRRVRQRARVPADDRPLVAGIRDDDDSRGVAEERADAREQAGVLRVSLVPHGAVGRAGVDRVHRRQVHRRRARSQRPAAEPLLPDARRPRDHGERGRRRADRSRERQGQGPPRARPHVPRRLRARPPRARRRAQERVREPPAVRRMARSESHPVAASRRREAAAPSVDRATLLPRLQAFGYTTETLQFMLQPMVREHRDPVGSMGNDSALAVLVRQAAHALRLFPAAVRAGDEPADRLDPRRSHHVARVLRRAPRATCSRPRRSTPSGCACASRSSPTRSWPASRT